MPFLYRAMRRLKRDTAGVSGGLCVAVDAFDRAPYPLDDAFRAQDAIDGVLSAGDGLVGCVWRVAYRLLHGGRA
jgi:hypothetical protein